MSLGQCFEAFSKVNLNENIPFIRDVAQEELNNADQEKIIGIAVLSFISLVTLVFYFFVKNALSVIRVRTNLA